MLALAILTNLPIGIVAYKKKSLRFPDGVFVAAMIGIVVFLAHPVLWFLLMAFFVSSSYLSNYKETSKEKSSAMLYAEKGGQRDSLQVFANGGTALLGSIIVLFEIGIAKSEYFSPIFLFVAISFASSAADTWATEIGTTSTSDPRWIFNLKKRVPKGTSGAVSLIGTTATAFGALFIAILFGISVFIATGEITGDIGLFIILITVGGTAGSLIDTLLGASYQSVYECPECGKKTEKRKHPHTELIRTKHTSGFKWLNNDMVNFLSGFISSLIFAIIYWQLF